MHRNSDNWKKSDKEYTKRSYELDYHNKKELAQANKKFDDAYKKYNKAKAKDFDLDELQKETKRLLDSDETIYL
jgi:hypothetical protein